MQILPEYIAKLLFRDLQGLLSEEEKRQLSKWVNAHPYNRELYTKAKDEKRLEKGIRAYKNVDVASAWSRLERMIGEPDKHQIPKANQTKFYAKAKYLWAASILLFLSFSLYLFFDSTEYLDTDKKTLLKEDVSPGQNGAILTLANGNTVLLDTMKNAELILEDGSTVEIIDGSLVFDKGNTSGETNTVSTPYGRQYNLTLSDGTKIWLNSASSISFPVSFESGKRVVHIYGEVYFEVAKNIEKPFFAITPNGTEIKVTGTQFNINTYSSDFLEKTTLIEGAIVVNCYGKSWKLRPGQQALRSTDKIKEEITLVKEVNMDKVVAWKNGLFNFDGDNLMDVLGQLERWYDIKVEYHGQIPSIKFFGEISREENLSDVLDALKESGVHFKIEKERRLVVTQN